MSKDHMAHELDVHRRARHQRLTPWRPGIVKKATRDALQGGEVERSRCDGWPSRPS